ncbi:MAG: hypothetical protein Crog4KO_19360 [Crocinitomicaceae bacterium]
MKEKEVFDVIIIGGGVAGSLMGISLMRKEPNLKVVIVERNASFPKKVGESTSDISTLYFRQLQLDHLLEKHPTKAGLRFLFNENQSDQMKDVSEFNSPTLKSSIGGRHLNRQVFDEDLLLEAEKLGCLVFRPAEVVSHSLQPFDYTLEIRSEEQTHHLNAPKFLDATGRARFLPKALGWKDLPLKLKNAAIFTRLQHPNASLQLNEQTASFWKQNAVNYIEYGTTHFMRKNAWFWLIRLSENEFSIGLVLDTNHHKVSDHEAYFKAQIKEEPLLASFFSEAQHTEIQYIPQLSYCSERLFEDGATVIGDSGAFTDPFISPGLEMICQQAAYMSELFIRDFRSGKFHQKRWKKYERTFLQSYQSRDVIYTHWYSIMHDFDLLTSWMRVSLFIYFGLYTNPAYAFPKRLRLPVRSRRLSKLGVRMFIARINTLAKKRERSANKGYKEPQVAYSGVRITNGIQLFTLPVVLFFRWAKSYLILEWRQLTNR